MVTEYNDVSGGYAVGGPGQARPIMSPPPIAAAPGADPCCRPSQQAPAAASRRRRVGVATSTILRTLATTSAVCCSTAFLLPAQSPCSSSAASRDMRSWTAPATVRVRRRPADHAEQQLLPHLARDNAPHGRHACPGLQAGRQTDEGGREGWRADSAGAGLTVLARGTDGGVVLAGRGGRARLRFAWWRRLPSEKQQQPPPPAPPLRPSLPSRWCPPSTTWPPAGTPHESRSSTPRSGTASSRRAAP